MRNSTINSVMDRSKKLNRAFIVWSFILVFSIIWIIRPQTHGSDLQMALSASGIIVALVAIGLNLAMVRNLPDIDYDNDEPEPPINATYESFPQEHSPEEARLEMVDGKTMRIGRYTPADGTTWINLANALHHNGWIFSRDNAVRQSKCFKNLTSQWPRILNDFQEMGIIKVVGGSWTVTRKGKLMFIDMSPNLMLEHM